MNSKILWVAVVVVAIIAAGAYLFPKVQSPLGSVVGPDSYFEYVANNDLQKYGQTVTLRTATTTVCAIKSPAATSTLSFAGVRFTVSSSTAATIALAKATTAYATTTILGNEVTLAAGAQATIVATSTATNLNLGNYTFAPNNWLVVGMRGGIGTFSPIGSCSAEFTRI